MSENTPEEYVPEHRAPEVNHHMVLRNRVYDTLKFVALVVLPALGSAYFGLATIWNLPNADEVVGTIVVIDTFLGVMLGLSSVRYKDDPNRFVGVIDYKAVEGEDEPEVQMRMQSDFKDLEGNKEITFKILPR